MEFIKKHMFATILVTISIILLVCSAVNLYVVWKPSIDTSNMRKTHMADEYNNGEKIFYLANYLDSVATYKNTNQIPWGINKSETMQLQYRDLVYESDSCLIFGPYSSIGGKFIDKCFVEFHFNNFEQLYKIVETSVLKYIYVEENPHIVEIYKNYKNNMGFLDTDETEYGKLGHISFSGEFDSFVINDITWKDIHGNERTVTTNEYLSSDEIYKLTGLIVDITDFNKMIINNNFIIVNHRECAHVIYKCETQKVNDEFVLSESTFINTLLEDN